MHPIHPRKRFGQNFLQDQEVIGKLVQCIAPSPEDHLIEIGPGLGALTKPLAHLAGRLTAIEIDRQLAANLCRARWVTPSLTVICQDALTVDFALFNPTERVRVVGNLPYNVSTPLLFHCLDYSDHIEDMHLMLQQEVVARMSASPGSRDYGRLTVMLAARCGIEPLFIVPPSAFWPSPSVTSQAVRIRTYADPPFDCGNWTFFTEVVRVAFSHRRKTLRNALKDLVDVSVLEEIGVNPQLRPEQLPPADFGAIARAHLAKAS